MLLPDFLNQTSDGEILLADHRIGLYHVICSYNEGESAEMLSSRYPSLPLSLVHKVIAFYLENQDELDDYIATCEATMARQRGEAKSPDLSALRQRLNAAEASVSAEAHGS